jgi:hypothetical protein
MILTAGGGGGGTSQRGGTSNDGGSGGTFINDLTAGGSTCAGGGAGGQGGGISVVYTQGGAIETGYPGAGGGAGGYTGTGGAGGIRVPVSDPAHESAQDGSGGGGGGGFRYGKAGSTGIYGYDGSNGSAGTIINGGSGSNGSLGNTGIYLPNGTITNGYFGAGGGGAGWPGNEGASKAGDDGIQGAVRIIWGNDRNYPSNRTKDLPTNTSQPGTIYYTGDTPAFEYNISTRGSSTSVPSTLATNAIGSCWLLYQFKPDSSSNTVNKSLCIPVLDDAYDAVGTSVGTYRVCARAISDQYTFTANQAGVTVDIDITPNPNPPIYTTGFLSQNVNLTEGTTSSVTVTRTASRNGITSNAHDLTLNWEIANADSRVSPTSGTVTIPAGENTASFNVAMSANNTDSQSTTNTITITSVSDPRYTITTPTATATLNNVFRSITVAATETVQEGNSTAITVTRLYKLNSQVAVPNEGTTVSWRITTSNDDRISQTAGTVSMLAGEETVDIEIPISQASGAQTNTTNTLRIVSATNNYSIAANSCTITIEDVVSVVKQMLLSATTPVDEGNSIVLTVTRTSTVDGVDSYTDTPTFAWRALGTPDSRISLTSGSGQFNAAQTTYQISIPTTDSTVYIGDTNNIFEIYNLGSGYTYPTNGNLATVTITDNGTEPTYTFSYPNGTEVTEGSNLTVSLTTTDIPDGTKLDWSILNLQSDTIEENDFTNPQTSFTYAVTNNGASAYTFNGESLSSIDNPELTLYRGFTYTFNVTASNHPFYIKTARGTGTGSLFSNGVTGNGATSGAVVFTVPLSAPDTLYYICEYHYGMSNILNIKSPSVIGKQVYVYNNSVDITVGTSDDTDTSDEVFQIGINDLVDPSTRRAESDDITITAKVPHPIGEETLSITGTGSWTAPAGVTNVSVVAVGGGGGGQGSCGSQSGSVRAAGGGGGGGLGYKNNITVVPGQSYAYQVGAGGSGGTANALSSGSVSGATANGGGGTDSWFVSSSTVRGGGGGGGVSAGGSGGTYAGDGGGLGGSGYNASSGWEGGGGGGAGGYSGNGGNAGPNVGGSGSGGGGGGAASDNYTYSGTFTQQGQYGGGVGSMGQGTSGTGGTWNSSTGTPTAGTNGSVDVTPTNGGSIRTGGGGGGGRMGAYYSGASTGGSGSQGYIRIIWGDNRSFPSNAS